jgi:hypothetical protein
MKGRPSVEKRRKEIARKDKQQEKAERRDRKRDPKPDRSAPEGEDPDLAGIVPGPQPPAEWQT